MAFVFRYNSYENLTNLTDIYRFWTISVLITVLRNLYHIVSSLFYGSTLPAQKFGTIS